jgi:hypothetical protein
LGNSGFKGPWGPANDKNAVNNRFFINLLNLNSPQQSSFSQVLAKETNFPSPGTTTTNFVEWVNSGQGGQGKMMLPIDMQIYHSFTPDSNGRASSDQGIYCAQGNNPTNSVVNNCPKGPKYLGFAKNANTSLGYAKSNTAYLAALVPAFLRMVTYNNPQRTLTHFIPSWGCLPGSTTVMCLGDILFTKCVGLTKPSKCP